MKASQAVTITCFSTPFGTAGRGAVILGPHCFFRAIPPIRSPMPVFDQRTVRSRTLATI